MRLPSLRAVLFDWDGTLLNSAEANYRCYEKLFGSFGIPFDRACFERTYSPNWYRTYASVGLPRERWAEADAAWEELYAGEECRLVVGAVSVLQRLRDAGIATGLVTGGSRARVVREVASLGVGDFFQTLVCGGDTRKKKPHPEALLLALGRLGVEAPGAAYVGDSPEDVEMARSAGVYSVGIAGAFPNREALWAALPDLRAASLEEATEVLLSAGLRPA